MILKKMSKKVLAIFLGVLCAILAGIVLLFRAMDETLSSMGERICLFAMNCRN